VDALWKTEAPANRPAVSPLLSRGSHSTGHAASAANHMTYTVFRRIHNCGDGDGFSYMYFIYTKKKKQ
jgi:hypothetical protein